MSIERLISTDSLVYHLRVKARALGADVEGLTNKVLDTKGFTSWTGGLPGRHHHGEGGLLRHTFEVVSLCMQSQETFTIWGAPYVAPRSLFLAALYHDYGKLWDYILKDPYIPGMGDAMEPAIWQSAPHHRLIHHINRSAIEWTRAVSETGLCKDIEDEVLHAILSHHGTPNMGSPVMPKTRLAWMLHLNDAMSAWMDGADSMEAKN